MYIYHLIKTGHFYEAARLALDEYSCTDLVMYSLGSVMTFLVPMTASVGKM